jgi:hypothetical protein
MKRATWHKREGLALTMLLPSRKSYWLSAACLGLVALALAGYSFMRQNAQSARAKYDGISLGMSRPEVEAIMGRAPLSDIEVTKWIDQRAQDRADLEILRSDSGILSQDMPIGEVWIDGRHITVVNYSAGRVIYKIQMKSVPAWLSIVKNRLPKLYSFLGL